MPGQFQHTLESLRKEAVDIASETASARSCCSAVPEHKDAEGSEAWNPDGIAQRAITVLRDELGDEHVVIGDLCLDEYTDHGHCGVLNDDGDVDNDATLERYRRDRASPRPSRAHMVGPSGMMDGQVGGDPRRAGRAGHDDVGDHGVRGEVRERVLRAVPRGGRVRAAVRRSHRLPAGSRQRRRGAPRDPRPTSTRAPTS